MKKILFVMQSLYNGGAEKSLVNLLNELPENQYDISLLLFKNEGMFLQQVPNYVHILNAPRSLKKLYSPVKKAGRYAPLKIYGTIASRLQERCSSEQAAAYRWQKFYGPKIPTLNKQFDLAVAYISGEVMYYVSEKVIAKSKYVWIHNDYRTSGHPREYDYPYLKTMDRIVSISDRCVEILDEEFPEMRGKICCIPNLTSSVVVRRRAEEFYPLEYKTDVFNILSIGRLNRQKGFDMAIQAAALMKSRGLRFKWYIVGNGELQETLEKQIQEKNVSDCFILLGSRENPYPYIKNCTVFAQPSRYEGKSVALDEAKILAKPVVTTNYSTIGDQISDGKEGIIVDMNPQGIANGLEKMMRDEQLRKYISDYLASHEYGNQDEVKKYMDLMDLNKY